MDSYIKLLSGVLARGEERPDRTCVGTLSVMGAQFRHDMRTGFPLLTTKRVTPRWIFEEIRWILSGSTDEKVLRQTGVDIWAEWATREKCEKFGREEGDLGPVYGHLWRQFGGTVGEFCDQIERLLQLIQDDPYSRRQLVSGWHPLEADAVELPPCHTLWQTYCHATDNRMSLSLYMRSCDVFLGLPYNIAGYAMLLTMLCHVTGRTPGDLVIGFGDLHLYRNHEDQASLQMTREPLPLAKVEIDSPLKGEPLNDLLAIRWEHVKVHGYVHHSKIAAEVAV